MSGKEPAKHQEIYETIHRAILRGEYTAGDRLPTEAELGETHNASRPTISRALRELEREGYLTRRRGAGTFVLDRTRTAGKLFGLTVSPTESGILSSICTEITHRAEAAGHAVLFVGSIGGEPQSTDRRIENVYRQFIARGVAGVFFMPLIVEEDQMAVNEQVARRFEDSGMSVVLLDHDIYDFPLRSRYDIVGVNNRRNGQILTRHLLGLGCRRIEFVSLELAVSTNTARIAGYKDAMRDAGIEPKDEWVHRWDGSDHEFVRSLITSPHADAYVCVNDDIARALMHHMATLGIQIPNDVRIVGFDDLPFAEQLPVPLTTLHQPTTSMGAVAVETMLSRLESQDMPAREILLNCELKVRSSCGAKTLHQSAAG